MKRIIIIGGMGPQASLELHRRIIKRAVENGAKDGGDFPHIVHFSFPIDDFISDKSKTAKAVKFIVQELSSFRFRAMDEIILACNTAHLFQHKLEQALGIQISSLIDATAQHIEKLNLTEVKLLASPTTVNSGLYSSALEKRGIGVVLPKSDELSDVETIIRSVIAGRPVRAATVSEQPVLLGCTELSCAFAGQPNVIDPMDIIIDEIMPRVEVI